jgi:ZIP family zinc transporter
MNPLLLTSMAAVSTSVGGYCAVQLQRKVHLLMSFGTGVLVGAALLGVFPSALSAAESSGSSKLLVFPIAAFDGLLIFCIGEAASRYRANNVGNRVAGRVSASFLVVHSKLDGTAIFAASTTSLQLGLIVGLGVVAHDICDGLNTILLATGTEKPGWTDYGFLALNAVAPIAGGLIAAHLFRVSNALVMVFLSLAAGSFLFTAFFGLLPDAWRRASRCLVLSLGLLGFLLMLYLTRLVVALGEKECPCAAGRTEPRAYFAVGLSL